MYVKRLSLFTILGLIASVDYLAAQGQVYDYNYGAPMASANPKIHNEMAAAPVSKAHFTNWSSGYLGLFGGLGQTNYKLFNKQHLHGAITSIGLFSGINMQSAALVYGVAADAALPFATQKNNEVVARRRFDSSMRARLGWDMGSFMPYGTLGIASDYISFSLPENKKKSTGRFRLGYVFGAGADVKITDTLIGEVECRKNSFGRKTYKLAGNEFASGLSSYSVRLGIATKF